jgi:hypothetical protein
MTAILIGPVSQSAQRDDIGHREYQVVWKVRTTTPLDGPAAILASWPLPAVGSTYSLDNDYDAWAFCTPELTIAAAPDVSEGDPFQDWHVTQKWSTNQSWRCQTAPVENPLLEPFQLSGDFHHEQKEASVDRFGQPLLHPNFQPITGPLVETKTSYPTVSITFNSATLPLSTYVLLINNVNDAPLWGLPARSIRFADARWERLVYGTCFYYFKTTYTFECNLDTFDPICPAAGTVACNPVGGNPANPNDFIPVQLNGENTIALLDKDGFAVTRKEDQFLPVKQIAKQGNLLLLGIPSQLL